MENGNVFEREAEKKRIIRVVSKNLDKEALQCYHLNDAQLYTSYINALNYGSNVVVEDNGLVFWGMMETPYLLRIHVFSSKFNYSIVEGSARLTKRLFEMIPLIKIYGTTPNKGFIALAKKAGWKEDGVLSKSFLKADGTIIDQFMFSAYREDFVSTKVAPFAP